MRASERLNLGESLFNGSQEYEENSPALWCSLIGEYVRSARLQPPDFSIYQTAHYGRATPAYEGGAKDGRFL